ncbi:MAG: SDH family Clp fold serine proteinase [Candidatus Binataceae bacterium]
MARVDRTALLGRLERARQGRLIISYITSTRTNFEMQIADDVPPLFYEHLEAHKEKAKNGVDLFIHSNGGSGTAPWRIVSLIREYTKNFAVLVPHRAFSAATFIALGADEIVMHRMGCLGPIDPSVANQFNPANPQTGLPIPISVEDVTAYFRLVKEEVGITQKTNWSSRWSRSLKKFIRWPWEMCRDRTISPG